MTRTASKAASFRVGILSDTHGQLPPKVERVLQTVNHIIHAGDVDSAQVLERLRNIAPVTVSKGNMDRGGWSRHLQETEIVDLNGIRFCVIHDLSRLDLDPATTGCRVVVNGHTHQPAADEKKGVLYLNPGSCVLPRNGLSPSLILLEISQSDLTYRLVNLSAAEPVFAAFPS